MCDNSGRHYAHHHSVTILFLFGSKFILWMWGYNQLWHKQQVLTEILMQLTKQQDSFFIFLMNEYKKSRNVERHVIVREQLVYWYF